MNKWTSESCSVMSDSLQSYSLYSLWTSPSRNTGVGSLFLLQGIFPTQGWSPGLLHCRRTLYQLTHKGSPHKIYHPSKKKKKSIYISHPNLKLWCGEKANYSQICLESSQNLTYVYQREVLNRTGSAKRRNGQTTMKPRAKGNNITFQLFQNPVKTKKKREGETKNLF